jgi:beta-glucanase (GH16 family)
MQYISFPSGRIILLYYGGKDMFKKIVSLMVVSAVFLGIAAFAQQQNTLSYDGYSLKFEDDFSGKTLNKKYWNYERHQPGWVNNELQEYVENKKNIYLKDGNLIIQPVKTTDKRGNVSYTSGRITMQGKVTAKYGIIEARIKVPQGQGYLPAFWMMPDNESLYGSWPLCGEIDIMEVLGSEINKSYSTLHFGEPHTQKQVSKVLTDGDFANEFHTFSCEWNPDEFRYYVDGNYIGSVTEWFTKKQNDSDPVTFPAPFDQPFYVILNVAVGGNWPGYPDETTTFDEKAQMAVDYVRIYQKDSYNDNVAMKEASVKADSGDASGNCIHSDGWKFLTALGGDGSADISGDGITVYTKNPGSVDYSVQLVNGGFPLVKGGLYEFSFDAYASENRTMMAGLTGPDNGYVRYFGDEKIELGTKKKNYKFSFQMKASSDPSCRIDLNMGATPSKGTIYISNVVVRQTGTGKIAEPEKTMTADGNYVYNGTFDRGDGRFKYWNKQLSDNASLEITNKDNLRACSVVVKSASENAAVLSQNNIALAPNTNYAFSVDSDSKLFGSVKILVNGSELSLKAPSAAGKPYTARFNTGKINGKSELKLVFSEAGSYVFDNVRIGEEALVKNGSFEKGMSGWELYTFTSGIASVKTADAASVTITDTTPDEWKIQLKQTGVSLEKGVTYRLTFDIASTLDRDVKYALQRDGTRWLSLYGKEDWTPYNDAPIVKAVPQVQTVVQEFQMTSEDDDHTILTFSLGTVNGNHITKEHTVTIGNIHLEAIQ